MPMLEWSDTLNVNIDKIDAQHRSLVEMVNRLHDAMVKNEISTIVLETVEKMRIYAQEHFATEERYMEKYNYPGLPFHRREHEGFVEKVLVVENDCKTGDCEMSMDILNFLSRWLVTHIGGTDKEMGDYLCKLMES